MARALWRLSTDWTAERSHFESQYGQIFLSPSSSTVFGPTQFPIQFVPGESDRGVKLTTHLQLVQRSRIRGSIYALPQMYFCCSAELIRTVTCLPFVVVLVIVLFLFILCNRRED
jgi:hypothetical protein